MELSFEQDAGVEFYTITKAEQTTSKSGFPMVVLKFVRNDGVEVKQYYLTDHNNVSIVIQAKMALKHLCDSWNLLKDSKVDLQELVGKTYTAELYDDKGFNKLKNIEKFVKPEASVASDEDIPF